MNSSKTISFENFAPPEDIEITYENIVQKNPAPGVGSASLESPPQLRRKEERERKRREKKEIKLLDCPYCPKQYRVVGWLRKHLGDVHKEEEHVVVDVLVDALRKRGGYDPTKVKIEESSPKEEPRSPGPTASKVIDVVPLPQQPSLFVQDPPSQQAVFWPELMHPHWASPHSFPIHDGCPVSASQNLVHNNGVCAPIPAQYPHDPCFPPSAYPPPPPPPPSPFQNFRGQAQVPAHNAAPFYPQPPTPARLSYPSDPPFSPEFPVPRRGVQSQMASPVVESAYQMVPTPSSSRGHQAFQVSAPHFSQQPMSVYPPQNLPLSTVAPIQSSGEPPRSYHSNPAPRRVMNPQYQGAMEAESYSMSASSPNIPPFDYGTTTDQVNPHTPCVPNWSATPFNRNQTDYQSI